MDGQRTSTHESSTGETTGGSLTQLTDGRRSSFEGDCDEELLRRGSLLLAQIAQMPCPHESFRKNDHRGTHDGQPN